MTLQSTGSGITSLVVDTHPRNSPLAPHGLTLPTSLHFSLPFHFWHQHSWGWVSVILISQTWLQDTASKTLFGSRCIAESSDLALSLTPAWEDWASGTNQCWHLGPLGVGAIWLSICRYQDLADIQIFPSGWTSLAKCGLSVHICPPGWP